MSADDDLLRASVRRALQRITELEQRMNAVEAVQASYSAILADLAHVRSELEAAAIGGRDERPTLEVCDDGA